MVAMVVRVVRVARVARGLGFRITGSPSKDLFPYLYPSIVNRMEGRKGNYNDKYNYGK